MCSRYENIFLLRGEKLAGSTNSSNGRYLEEHHYDWGKIVADRRYKGWVAKYPEDFWNV